MLGRSIRFLLRLYFILKRKMKTGRRRFPCVANVESAWPSVPAFKEGMYAMAKMMASTLKREFCCIHMHGQDWKFSRYSVGGKSQTERCTFIYTHHIHMMYMLPVYPVFISIHMYLLNTKTKKKKKKKTFFFSDIKFIDSHQIRNCFSLHSFDEQKRICTYGFCAKMGAHNRRVITVGNGSRGDCEQLTFRYD